MTTDEVMSRLMAEMTAYKGAEPFDVLITFLAAELDPECCGDLKPEGLRQAMATEGCRRQVCVRATIYLTALCSILESEYAAYFSSKRTVAQA